MLTFESRAKRIVQRLSAGFSPHDVDWVCKEFWCESDIAMRKHILLTLFKAMPGNDFDENIRLVCQFSDDSIRASEIVREAHEWSLR